MDNAIQHQHKPAIFLTIIVYFFWGFAASSNALLIPVFKHAFHLTQFKAQLVELSFYMAYFFGSVIYFLISVKQGDILNKIGAKKGMIIGLLLAAIGSLMMIPAANSSSYPLFLAGLFVIGLGFTLQQIVANPLLVQLGDPEGGTNRLLLAGSINSFGNTIAPLLLSAVIFGAVAGSSIGNINSVKIPYIILTACYLVFASIYYIIKMPLATAKVQLSGKKFGALAYPQVRWGMLAILCYVGGEVTMQSNLPALVKSETIMGLDAGQAVHLFSLFGGSLMIGRCAASLSNFKLKRQLYVVLTVVVPFFAYGIVLLVNFLKGSPMADLYGYAPFVILVILCILLGKASPAKLLYWSAIMAIGMVSMGIMLTGKYALYSIISVAFFCSLMWPCIFFLAIANLKEYTNQASSLLVMMIVGGAIIPPVQGLLSDHQSIGIHYSYFVPLLCFAYILFFAIRIKSISK